MYNFNGFKSNYLHKTYITLMFSGVFHTKFRSTMFASPHHTNPFTKVPFPGLKNQGKILQKIPKNLWKITSQTSKNLREPKIEPFSWKTLTFGRAKNQGCYPRNVFCPTGFKVLGNLTHESGNTSHSQFTFFF